MRVHSRKKWVWIRLMKTELGKIIADYAAFEKIVRKDIAAICEPHCSVCQSVCCGVDYCRENIDSPFLGAVSAGTHPEGIFCSRHGWLTPTGCALSLGRPSVCYQFNCDKIIQAQSDELTRYLTRVLSNLIAHVGKRALGSRHLVEIMDPARLNKIKYERFQKRLIEARSALQEIRSISRHGFLPASSLQILSRIVTPPDHLADTRSVR